MENEKKFAALAAMPNNNNWDKLIKRESELYKRYDDIRNAFERDYTRILHSLAFRRLKHKTQVYSNIDNDHVCTRVEHVIHVDSVSHTIATKLGLNTDLTKAISNGHDLGHAPFGHRGEKILAKIATKYLKENFWHEKNGLHFVDDVELLEDYTKTYKNLYLTYAVRDGIISHCGEVDENGLRPRDSFIDLKDFYKSGQFQPVTWEGCIVKISDKIAYLGRDIEDAIRLGMISGKELKRLEDLAARTNIKNAINTTVIINSMIIDICKNSSPEKGICLSNETNSLMNEIKLFNSKYIYKNKRLITFEKFSKLIIEELFKVLFNIYKNEKTLEEIEKKIKIYPDLMSGFLKWLVCYCTIDYNTDLINTNNYRYDNKKIYKNLETEDLYIRAILDYISGMTDAYAIKVFNGLLKY